MMSMSLENPGDDIRCDWCDRPGTPYTYHGQTFSGLCSTEDGKLCKGCRDIYLDQHTPDLTNVPFDFITR